MSADSNFTEEFSHSRFEAVQVSYSEIRGWKEIEDSEIFHVKKILNVDTSSCFLSIRDSSVGFYTKMKTAELGRVIFPYPLFLDFRKMFSLWKYDFFENQAR